MARQNVGVGTVPGDNTGDPNRTAFDKFNDNYIELYDLTTSLEATLSALNTSITALIATFTTISTDMSTINATLLDLQDQLDVLDVRLDDLET